MREALGDTTDADDASRPPVSGEKRDAAKHSTSAARSTKRRDSRHVGRDTGGLMGRLNRRLFGLTAPNKTESRQPRSDIQGLGKYAGEAAMPARLASFLHERGEVKTEGMIRVLRQLLEQNKHTRKAYLCHPAVVHISKLKGEGGFCGYRNIQMLFTYVNGASTGGTIHFQGNTPTIFEIQDEIEGAWDRGINPRGRAETGGIRGTRKYIGTAEAQAMFKGLEIPCNAQAYMHSEPGRSQAELLRDVQQYFEHAIPSVAHGKVFGTNLPPIYFQHQGHSMTIIGLEIRVDGAINLLVFDPSRADSSVLTRLVGRDFRHNNPDPVLRPYRRGSKYLSKYREYETLRLTSVPS